MATPSILQKLGSKAKDLKDKYDFLPGDSEVQGLKAIQQNVNGTAMGQPGEQTAPTTEEPTADKNNPMTRYGSRPGEVRYNVDIDGNLTPVQSTPASPVEPSKTAPKSVVKEHMDVDTGKPASRLPELAPAIKHTPTAPTAQLAPVYDDGGDVDVNDGKHQVAILEDGERVLTPDQNEQYKKEHGATPKGDVSNPLPADIASEQSREISTGLKPYSQVMDERQKAKDKVNNPGVQTLGAEPVKPRGGTPAEQKAVDTDSKNAMGQGVAGMTQLGLAKLHEKLLRPTEEKGALEQGATAPPGLNGGPNAPDAATQGAPAGPGLPKLGGPAATTPPAAPSPLGRKATIKDYDTKIAAALKLATPEGQEQAERLANAKQEFIHHNPWGSADNHPGVLGKLGHVAEQIGARLPIISSVVNQIPGSEGARNAEHNATLGQIEKDTPLTTARGAEVAKANTDETSAKNAGTNGQQYAQSLRDLAAAEATHDPAKIAVAQRAADDAKKALDESKPVAKIPTGDEPLGPELVAQYNKELTDRYQVLNPGKQLPQEFMLPPTATANDYARRHTAMEGVEKATGTKTQQDTANQQKTEAAAVHKEEHAGKLYDDYNKQVDKVSAPMEAISSRATLLLHNLDAKDKQTDAQVAPELLSIASGGVGSGLRMNEAEISRVVGGRSVWDSLIAMANKVREGEGTFSDEQRLQMHKIGEYIYDRAAAVTTVYSDAKDRMLTDKDRPDQVRKDYNDAKRIANQIVRQGIVPQGGKPKDGDFVFHNGQVLIVKGGKGYPALQ